MDAQVQKEKQTTDFLDPEKVKELLIIKVNKKLLQDKEEAVSNDLCSFKCFFVRVELVLTSSFCIQELLGAERSKGDSQAQNQMEVHHPGTWDHTVYNLLDA